MWPYAKRRSRFLGDATESHASSLGAADFSTNDSIIKLWLSERLLAAIDVLCDEHDASRPDVLRWLLFEHAYGRVELTHLRRRVTQQETVTEPEVKFSVQRRAA